MLNISRKIKLIEIELELRRRKKEEIDNRWHPLPGPQTLAYNSLADNLFYGGAAGGAKTDLLLGLALKKHKKSIIFRREFPQFKEIIKRTKKLYGDIGKYNTTEKTWTIGTDQYIEFGAVENAGDEEKYMGRPHDMRAFDEITHFLEEAFIFLSAWTRTDIPGQRTRVVCTGNPPTSPRGYWIRKYWGAWLDEKHHNPAEPGELRFYTTIDEEDVELETGDPFTHKGEIIIPQSRTFIPARVEDNPYLMATGYKTRLQALREPFRSQLLYGNFVDLEGDDRMQVIPTAWIKAAQERWRNGRKREIPMTALGADPSRGGKDKTVLTPRYANRFEKQITAPGKTITDGWAFAQFVLKNVGKDATVNIDVIGIGSAAYDCLKGLHKKVVALNSSEASDPRATDASGLLTFFNQRAEWWWKFYEALDPSSGQDLEIPDDPELLADLTAFKYTLTARGIQIQSKEEVAKKLGRSPDKGDSLVYAHAIKWEPPEPRFRSLN